MRPGAMRIYTQPHAPCDVNLGLAFVPAYVAAGA